MAKFIIVRGREYEAKFIIKATGSTTPVVLDLNTDSGTFNLSSSGINPCILLEVPMTITDADNGEFKVNLTAAQTKDLPYDEEFGEDKYPLVATCKAVLDISTVSEGKIYGDIPDVYVQYLGDTACPTT